MEALYIIGGYLLVCAAICCFMALRSRRNGRLPIPPAPLYYILSFLWGFPVTLAGCAAALVLRLAGRRPEKKGYNWYFPLKKATWGLCLGIFAFVPERCSGSLAAHEHGHGIQNAWFGPFMPFVVIIPSAVRFWIRTFRSDVQGRTLKRRYDDIWFEGTATLNGERAVSAAGREQNRPERTD